jgi:hypothetical protein
MKLIILKSHHETAPSLPPTRVKYHLHHKSGKSEESEEPTESGLF